MFPFKRNGMGWKYRFYASYCKSMVIKELVSQILAGGLQFLSRIHAQGVK